MDVAPDSKNSMGKGRRRGQENTLPIESYRGKKKKNLSERTTDHVLKGERGKGRTFTMGKIKWRRVRERSTI